MAGVTRFDVTISVDSSSGKIIGLNKVIFSTYNGNPRLGVNLAASGKLFSDYAEFSLTWEVDSIKYGVNVKMA